MQLIFRTIVGSTSGILVLAALGTIGFLSALASPRPATNQHGSSVLAQGMGGMAGGMPGMPANTQPPKELVIPWQKPSTPAPDWLDSKADANQREEKIRSTLNDRMDIELVAAPIHTVMAFISTKMEIPIILDEKALEDESITTDEPITIKREGTKVRDVLMQILDPLQLTYKIDLEAVMITSRKSYANKVRFYDLSYIFPDNSLIRELVTAIESMVAPSDWQSAGGNSSLTTVGCMLLINAPEETHLATEHLLRAISKQAPANLKPRVFLDRTINKPADNEKPGEKREASGGAK